jgi:hypothetical protein
MKTQNFKLRKKTLFVFRSATRTNQVIKSDPTSDLTTTSQTSTPPPAMTFMTR